MLEMHLSIDEIVLADWMEINALRAADGGVSSNDVAGWLRTAALFQDSDGDEAVEQLVTAVFSELESREIASVDAYPFEVEYPMLRRREDWRGCVAYVFCLCLSCFGERYRGSSRSRFYPRRCFEHVARDAVVSYLGGNGVRFAFPRCPKELPQGFAQAINCLSGQLKEGDGYRAGGLPNRQDGGLDIVAWKHFPDGLPGKIVMFGNCATEKDWAGPKKTELTPKAFCDEWFATPMVSRILPTLFIPHRIKRAELASHSRRAGIIFDRCRLAYWAHSTRVVSGQRASANLPLNEQALNWTESVLAQVRA